MCSRQIVFGYLRSEVVIPQECFYSHKNWILPFPHLLFQSYIYRYRYTYRYRYIVFIFIKHWKFHRWYREPFKSWFLPLAWNLGSFPGTLHLTLSAPVVVSQTCCASRLSFLSLAVTSTSPFIPRNKQILSQSYLPNDFWHSQTLRFCLPCMPIVLLNKMALHLILFHVFIICMYAFLTYSKNYWAPAMSTGVKITDIAPDLCKSTDNWERWTLRSNNIKMYDWVLRAYESILQLSDQVQGPRKAFCESDV